MEEQRTIIPGTWAGAMLGALLGYMLVRFGVVSTLIVIFLAIVGYALGGVLRGEIDILDTLSRLQQRNRRL
jgi:uncharacterized membrane protein